MLSNASTEAGMLARPLWVRLARYAVTPMTAGLASMADAPLQRSELAKSATSGHSDHKLLIGSTIVNAQRAVPSGLTPFQPPLS